MLARNTYPIAVICRVRAAGICPRLHRRGRVLWLGMSDDTNEHVVAHECGVCLTRTIRRLPEADHQGQGKMVLEMSGIPWDPTEGLRP